MSEPEPRRSRVGQITRQLFSEVEEEDLSGPIRTFYTPHGSKLGWSLIGLGMLWLFLRGVSQIDFTGGGILLTIGSVFLLFAFWKRIYGLMIPGMILAGMSIGVSFAELSNGVSVLWGLALSFLAIFVIGRVAFGLRSEWAVYPAVILFAVGIIVAISSGGLLGLFSLLLPLLLIVLGVVLGFR